MNAYAEYQRLHGLILAAEDWDKSYKEHDESFLLLVKSEAMMARYLVGYFKDLADRIDEFVNWAAYESKRSETLAAADTFNVDVIVADIPDGEDTLVMQVVFEPIALAAKAGMMAAEFRYGITLPDEDIQRFINNVSKENVATLVGRRVDSNGNIVPAKNPKYRISNVTRDLIRESVRVSLSIGEDATAATKRIQSVIKDAKRAEKIAATESVNAYQGAEYEYAVATEAKAKEWESLAGACRVCTANVAAGRIGIKDLFPSGHAKPAAHPRDRCSVRYVYQEELDLET